MRFASSPLRPPTERRLRVYAFDPSLSTRMDTALINHATLTIPWEDLSTGPIGEYIEVVDVDPASGCAYAPLDLDAPYLLAQNGLTPSEGNPQFHQQMVYAVAMKTIRNFEKALGRRALWSGRRKDVPSGFVGRDAPFAPPVDDEQFVQRLRIYPHALREANAYYSPDKKALLFGYFPASSRDPGRHFPGGVVFTCLSQDVVAHETAHALLDGMHRSFIERSNEDGLAFHEAFADIVALFQHFSLPEVLEHQISRTRGDLESQNLLGQLAQEFGQAIGAHGALRDALGTTDSEGVWHPRRPNPDDLARTYEPHTRGALLVAAVFGAFLAIYKSRIADLLRIATGGTGVLPQGEITGDLVRRLCEEAAKVAQHVLTMCIRALDYMPPVDVTFGDYFRALITADYDLVPEDPRRYRVAFIESFRRYGIYPADVRTLSEDALKWRSPEELGYTDDSVLAFHDKLKGRLTVFANEWRLSGGKMESSVRADVIMQAVPANLRDGSDNPRDQDAEDALSRGSGPRENRTATYREAVFNKAAGMRAALHQWLRHEKIENDSLREILGLDLGILDADGRVSFEVHSVRPTRRIGPDGQVLLNMVIEVTQCRPKYLDATRGDPTPTNVRDGAGTADFWFRGGATLIVDLETSEIRYVIRKDIGSTARLQRQRDFLSGRSMERSGTAADAEATLRMAYFRGGTDGTGPAEPFAMLHRGAPRADEARRGRDKDG